MSRRVVRLCAALALCSSLMTAQVSSLTGAVNVRVRDPQGHPVAGAIVTLRSEDVADSRRAETGSDGGAVLANVRPGPYTMRVESPGFSRAEVRELLVSIGQTANQDVRLSLASASQQMDVVEQADALQVSATTQSFTVGYERMEHAPSPGRNYLNFVFTAPGISPSSGASSGRSPAGSWNLNNDSGFSFAGIRGRNNSVSIDGVDNRDETTGATRVSVPLEMIQELRVAGTTVSASFGGAAGGMVNIVTRSGGAAWHGHGEFGFGHEALNARNAEFLIPGRPHLRRYQPGGSASGPLVRNRTFFAGAMEWFREDCDEWSETSPEFLAALAGPRYQDLRQSMVAGVFRAGERNQQYSAKVLHHLNDAHSITARVAYSKGSVHRGVQGVENFTDFTSRASSVQEDISAVFGLLSAFHGARINNLNVQLARRNVGVTPNWSGAQHEIPGVLTFGQGFRSDQSREETHAQIVNEFSWTVGRHIVSIGGDLRRVGLDSRIANRFGGVFVFPTLDAFRSGAPDVYLRAFGEPRTRMSTVPFGLWINDRFQITRGLSVEAGLRYDRQWMPQGLPASNLNFAPRVGVAWNPRGESRWVFRAGAGLFFDRYPLAFLNEAIQKDGWRAFEVYSAGPDAIAAFRGDPWKAAPVYYKPSREFPTTYAARLTAGVERLIDRNTTLTFEYSFARALHLPRLRNAAGTLPPEFLLEQTARSSYNGATVSVNRRLADEFAFLVSFTAGRAMDDGSDFDEQPMNPANVSLDWGRSRQYQARRVTATLFTEVPLEWLSESLEHIHFVPSFAFGSGRPVNRLLTTDAYRTGAYPISARPAAVERNSYLGPAIASLDFRLFKEWHFEKRAAKWQAGVEAYNILNHANPLRLNPFVTPGAPALSRPGVLEFSSARQIQLFTHFEF